MGSVLSSSHTFNIKPLHVSGVTCAPEHSSVSPRAFDMVNYRRRPRGATFWSPVGGILNFTYKQNCRWTHRGAFVRRSHKAVLVHSNLNTIAGVKTRQRAAEVSFNRTEKIYANEHMSFGAALKFEPHCRRSLLNPELFL